MLMPETVSHTQLSDDKIKIVDSSVGSHISDSRLHDSLNSSH